MSNTITYQVNGLDIDLQKALPLTLKDWDELKKAGFSQSDMATGDTDTFKLFAGYVLQKANPEFDPAAFDGFSLANLTQVIADITEYSKFAEVDRDFLKRSSTLPKSSDGQGASS